MKNQTYKEICLLWGIYLTGDKFVLQMQEIIVQNAEDSGNVLFQKVCKILPICLNVIRGVQTCDMVHSNRITAFCDMTPYNLVYRYKYFEVDFCLHLDADRSTL